MSESWLSTISFRVRGTPKGQPRPRAFARKVGDKFTARVYDAGTAEGWKSEIAITARKHLPDKPWDAPIMLTISYYLARPKSHFNKAGIKPSAPVRPTGKPDLDNLDKAVMDAMTTLGFWRDDSLVVHKASSKHYEHDGAGAEIAIAFLAQGAHHAG